MYVDCIEKDYEGVSYRLRVRIPLHGPKIIRFQVARLVQGEIRWWTIPASLKDLKRLMEDLFCEELRTHL